MLIIIVASLIFTENRRLVESFPEGLTKHWEKFELRATVVFSLTLQIVLIALGNRRKYNTKNRIRFFLWLVYQLADWVVTFSLGILSHSKPKYKNDSLDPKYVIMAFWAPFLLVHLGGPDTITAYSLEDNELWPRHLLTLIFQFRVAVFVISSSWTGTPLNFLVIPMFIAAIVKNGERTWALRSASSDQLRDSMLPQPDPGPNYAKFMDEYTSKKAEGYKVELGPGIKDPPMLSQSRTAVPNTIVPDAAILHDAFCFFNTFKRLFADLILSFQDLKNSQSFFQAEGMTWEKAFKVIEVELGFMYDVLYTKAAFITSFGGILRLFSLSSTISAFVVFLVIDKGVYSLADVNITLSLLVGAIGLEIYAIIILLSSDWIMLWVSKQKNPLVDLMYQTISCLRSCYLLPLNKRWSNSMAKYNLISFCLKEKPAKRFIIRKLLSIYQFLEKHLFKDLDIVSPNLKKLIFEELLKKSRMELDIRVCKQLCAYRGDQVLREMGCFDEFGWSVEAEFDQSILLWHIATDLCYYFDQSNNSNIVEDSKCKTSNSISDYMLYLLVRRPFMLPDGIGQIRLQDTCAEAIECFQERKHISDSSEACKTLLQVNTEIPPSELKGDRSKSVLFDACILAKSLQSLETEKQWTNEQKWEMMSRVWVEMLSYAASQCRWDKHAKQLKQGGELLTHVWFLMAHLGITEKFQISQGHARAKLSVS